MTKGKRAYLLECAQMMAYFARWKFLVNHLHQCGVCRTFADAGRHTGRPI